MKKSYSDIIKALSYLTQVGLTAIIPIFIWIYLAEFIREKLSLKEYFAPFGNIKLIVNGAILIIVQLLLVVIGVFVLIFPVYLSFCMAPFILSDHPEMSFTKALSYSRKMMKGRKMEAFLTVIPVFGFVMVLTMLLGSSLLGILFTSVAQAVFYLVLARVYDKIKNERLQSDDMQSNIEA